MIGVAGPRIAITLFITVIMAVTLVTSENASAAPLLKGSQVLTVERSDVGEVFAAASIVLELDITSTVGVTLIHDQAITLPSDRYSEWDVSMGWRPTPEWSVSVGRRWRVGPPPTNGGPWTYVQVWSGFN